MHHDDDDDATPAEARRDEFECPDCNAHNPVDDGFTVGDEITCFYCGSQFRVVSTTGKLKLKAQ